MAKKGSKGGGNTVLAFVLGAATVVAGGYAWTHYGGSARKLTKNLPSLQGNLPSLPSGVSSDGGKSGDPAMAKSSGAVTANTPPPSHAKRTPPFGISEDVFEAGARTYHARCAGCHGTPAHESKLGKSMTPPAPQLWKTQKVIDGRDPGDTYERIAHGVHGSGMPSSSKTMTDTQLWEVTLLLENAGKELPDPVVRLLEAK